MRSFCCVCLSGRKTLDQKRHNELKEKIISVFKGCVLHFERNGKVQAKAYAVS
jgi:hypothetical protein